MALINTRGRRTHQSFYEGSDYTPHQIGEWVAVDERNLPWNTIGKALAGSAGEGSTVSDLMTATQVLDATGLNIEVKKVALKDSDNDAIIMGTDKKGDKYPNLFATYYDDPDAGRTYFGAVSDKYEVLQPAEALSFFDNIVSALDGAHYSAAWVMREKSMMGVTIELPDEIVIDPQGADDRMGLHLLGINSFDGSTSLLGVLDATRWFCMNQLVPALRGARRQFSMRHTRNVRGRVVEAKQMIGVVYDYAQALDKVANQLYAAKMTDAQFQKFIARLPQFSLDGVDSPLKRERIDARRQEAVAHWNAPHNANITGTRWGALNVVGEFVEWGRNVKGSPRTGTDPVRQRAIGTLVHPTVTGTVSTAADMLLSMR